MLFGNTAGRSLSWIALVLAPAVSPATQLGTPKTIFARRHSQVFNAQAEQ